MDFPFWKGDYLMVIFKNRKKAGILICLLSAVILAGALTFAFADAPETDTVVRWSPVGDVGVIDGVTVVWPNATDTDLDFAVTAHDNAHGYLVESPDYYDKYSGIELQKALYGAVESLELHADIYNPGTFWISFDVCVPSDRNYTAYFDNYDEMHTRISFSLSSKHTYDSDKDLYTIHIGYSDLNAFLTANSEDGITRFNVTPVLKRLTGTTEYAQTDGYDSTWGYDLNKGYYSGYKIREIGGAQNLPGHSLATWETVTGTDIPIWHDLITDSYYSDYDVPSDLPAGVYNIAFVVTFRDSLDGYYAFVIDGTTSAKGYRLSQAVPTRVVTAEGAVETDTDARIFFLDETSPCQPNMGYLGNGELSFAVPDTEAAPIELTFNDYEFGRFDKSMAQWQYADGEKSGDLFTNLLGGRVEIDYDFLAPEFIGYKLWRVYDNGLRQRVYGDRYGETSGTADAFAGDWPLNELNVGKYEIEVLYNACEVGGKTYLPGFAKTTFTVKPATITADSADIYVASLSPEFLASFADISQPEGIDGYTKFTQMKSSLWNEQVFRYNTAALPDYLAYQQGYPADLASATELYRLLQVEYDKVAASYGRALSEWINFNSLSGFVREFYTSNSGFDYEVARQCCFADYDLTLALQKGKSARFNRESTWTDLAYGTRLFFAYTTYVDYINTYREYRKFCAAHGIMLPDVADEIDVFDAMISDIFENVVWKENMGIWYLSAPGSDHYTSTVTDLYVLSENVRDKIDRISSPRPPAPHGLAAPASLTTYWNDDVGFPPIILLKLKEFTKPIEGYSPQRDNFLELLYNQTALFVEYFNDIYVMPQSPTENLFDFGIKQNNYLAYRVTDTAGEDILAVAIKPGDYPLALKFEGNYTGEITGLTYRIVPSAVDCELLFGEETVQTDYSGMPVKYLQSFACSSSFSKLPITYKSASQIAFNTEMARFKGSDGYISIALLNAYEYYYVGNTHNGTVKMDCVIQRVRDAYGNAVTPTTVTDAVAAGTYTFTYSVPTAKSFLTLEKDGTPVDNYTTTVVIEPFEVDMAVRIPFCEDGDLAAVRDGTELRVITAPAGTQRENAVQFDISRAVFVEETPEPIEAFCVSGTSLPLDARLGKNTDVMMLIPVTLTDVPSCTWGKSVQAQNVNGQDWLVYEFTVGLETVALEWNPDAVFTVGYDGTCKYDPAVFTASFTDREGNRHPLEVYCLNECVNVGVYALDVRFASGTDDADHYRLGLHSLRFITILPVEARICMME